MVEPLLSGIVLGLIPITLAGLFMTAYLQYRRGDQLELQICAQESPFLKGDSFNTVNLKVLILSLKETNIDVQFWFIYKNKQIIIDLMTLTKQNLFCPFLFRARKDGRVVDGVALEMLCRSWPTEGSNPSSS